MKSYINNYEQFNYKKVLKSQRRSKIQTRSTITILINPSISKESLEIDTDTLARSKLPSDNANPMLDQSPHAQGRVGGEFEGFGWLHDLNLQG